MVRVCRLADDRRRPPMGLTVLVLASRAGIWVRERVSIVFFASIEACEILFYQERE
jgi:hypothetical protein